jgi:hypothetical protein
MYSSYSFSTSALDGSVWSASHPGRALPFRGKYPLHSLGSTQELVWTPRLQEKSFSSAGDRTPVVQAIVRHYTDYATPAPTF